MSYPKRGHWKTSNEVLRPESQVANQMKIVKDGQVIDNPKELAEIFGHFFIEKVDDIIEEIIEQKGNDKEKIFRCSQCDKTFTHNTGQQDQERTEDKPLSCDQCDKKFDLENDMREQEKLHTSEKSFICDHCNKNFDTEGAFIEHDKKHNGKKPFGCQQCDSRSGQ